MATIKEQLFHEVAECDARSNNKVTVVGIGQVGMACAFSILTQVRLKKWIFLRFSTFTALWQKYKCFYFLSSILLNGDYDSLFVECFKRCSFN